MLDGFLSRPIAHKGLYSNSFNIPENSIPAFKKAIELGLPVELDIQLTQDNHIIVFHDYNLKRMCGINKLVKKTTIAEIKKLNLINSDHKIPSLSEVLDLVNTKVPILIDLKNRNRAGKLETILSQVLDNYNGNIAIQSFNPFSLRWFSKHTPDIIRGQLYFKFKNKIFDNIIKYTFIENIFNFIGKPNFISFRIIDIHNQNIMNTIKNSKSPVILCTVKSKEDYKKAIDICDNVIFEDFIPDNI
jgi:glycerophosphoryl diester phosphodiesterase